MATEKRFIDAKEAVIKMSGKITFLIQHGASPMWVYNRVLQVIAESPTVDAVEVVRCKDCVYNANGCCTRSEQYDDTKYRPDYFCADGERKTSDETR